MKYGTKILRSKICEHTDTIVSKEIYSKLGFEIDSNIIINFKRNNFPKPHGMSGGGVWLKNISYMPKLVGICIEYDKKLKVMIGTRIGAVIEAIRNRYSNYVELPKTNFQIEFNEVKSE